MEFCNKGMVRADPPPVMVKDHKFTFFLDPSLIQSSRTGYSSQYNICVINAGLGFIEVI